MTFLRSAGQSSPTGSWYWWLQIFSMISWGVQPRKHACKQECQDRALLPQEGAAEETQCKGTPTAFLQPMAWRSQQRNHPNCVCNKPPHIWHDTVGLQWSKMCLCFNTQEHQIETKILACLWFKHVAEMLCCFGIPGEAAKLSCRARHARHCHWDPRAMGCSGKEWGASNTSQQPCWATWLLNRE